MVVTDLPNLSMASYGGAEELKRELAKFATYAQMHNRTDLSAWLLEAYTACAAIMPASGGGGS
jgi:hypothetical protein